jgi:hypothetical protein
VLAYLFGIAFQYFTIAPMRGLAPARSLAVFKNGLGFFIRTGEAQLEDGWGMTEFVPQAALGTFWMATSAPGAYVDQVVAYTENREKTVEPGKLEDLLAINKGKQVRIRRSGQPDVQGEVLGTLGGNLVRIRLASGEVTILAINSIVALVVAIRFPTAMAWWNFVVAVALVIMSVLLRTYGLRNQDRIIRLEERLRLATLLPPDLRGRINELHMGDLLALRFCSDEEVPEVTRRVLAGELKGRDAIKQAVKNWRPDYHRL